MTDRSQNEATVLHRKERSKEKERNQPFLLVHDLFIFDGHNKIIC